MDYTGKEIQEAVNVLKLRFISPIVQYYNGYIILAQSEIDLMSKKSKISRGDTLGFYTVESVLKFK